MNSDPGAPGGGAEEAAGSRSSGALGDVRILDVSRLLPGGFCSQLLADFGADVVKVEDTGMGDYVRWAPPNVGPDSEVPRGASSATYMSLNRNKRSIRLDLKSDAGREAFLRLVPKFDVVLDGFRPGVMDKLGLGFEALKEANPAIVYCAITGYGLTGPNVKRAGHDTNYLALGGLLGLTGEPDGRPISSAGQIADIGGGGLMAAIGILAALHSARRTGVGQIVDVSMCDGAQSWLAMAAAQVLGGGEVPRRGTEVLTGGAACYRPYECADGWVSCGALEPKFWQAFCAGVGRDDLINEQFSGSGSEGQAKIAEVFKSKTRAEWAAFNDEHDCCVEPVLDLDEALETDLTREREMVIEWDQPGIGPVRQLGFPIKLSETPGEVHTPAPAFGEHTRELLSEAGYSETEIDGLLESGAAAGEPEVPAGEFLT